MERPPVPNEPPEHRARLRNLIGRHSSLRDELIGRVSRIQETEAIIAGQVVSEDDNAATRHYVTLALAAFIDLMLEADLLIGPREMWEAKHPPHIDDDWTTDG